MISMLLAMACTVSDSNKSTEPIVDGAIDMNMIVSSAINGEYEPCG